MNVVRDTIRVLCFRAGKPTLERLGPAHLKFGLVCTWVVGIGRWWDDPRANLVQHLGLGSVGYVFGLALVLWLFALPVADRPPTYRRVLTYVTLTAPPALLYAIPIERWTDLATARAVNVLFLGVVAAWRVALYIAFLVRGAGMRWLGAVTTTLLPIALVIVILTFLNLERAVFDIMGGLREDGTPHDEAYQVLVGITMLSIVASPVLLGAWLAGVWSRERRRQRSQ